MLNAYLVLSTGQAFWLRGNAYLEIRFLPTLKFRLQSLITYLLSTYAQIYTLRDSTKQYSRLWGTMRRLRMGYMKFLLSLLLLTCGSLFNSFCFWH